MAARKNRGTKEHPWHPVVKNKTRATMLKNELTKHVLGERQMTPTQVSAAKIVLDRLEPVLAAIEHSGETTTSYVVRMPEPVKDMAEWTTTNTQQDQPVTDDKPLTTH